jgi:hypothetical protein
VRKDLGEEEMKLILKHSSCIRVEGLIKTIQRAIHIIVSWSDITPYYLQDRNDAIIKKLMGLLF